MSWLQGGWRKLCAVSILIFGLVVIVRDRQGNYEKLELFQRRLLACTGHTESLSLQLEVINHHKEDVERMLAVEKNVSGRVSQAYESKIQFLSAKNENLQMQLKECKSNGGHQGAEDVTKLQTENNGYRTRVAELERQIRQLNEQIMNNASLKTNDNLLSRVTFSTVSTTKSVKTTAKAFVNPEDHEDVNIQPVENPNFNFVENEIMFHKKPREPLVFRRGGNEPPQVVADLLPHEELLKKIDERKVKKQNDENVEDFREPAKPDNQEMDYKEMEQH